MKLRLNLFKVRLIIVSVIVVAASVFFGYWLGTHQVKVSLQNRLQIKVDRKLPVDKQNIDFSLFWEVWDRLEQDYLDKSSLDQTEMVFGAIQGMVSALDDPYTVFLKPPENKEVKDDLNGAFEGVGIQLGYQNEQLTVIAPLKGTPAFKAGVKTGDLILKIDDKPTSEITLPEAVKMIRGPKGTEVVLTLLHKGEKETYEAKIERDTIIVASVEVEFVDDEQIAHLRLLKFGDRTTEEWNKAVQEITNHQPKVKGVVLDLRNNPGGYLSGSVFIASEFLSSGIVVQQERADGKGKETYSVNRTGHLLDIPLVILVNGGSASASEIVAGALQDHNRSQVMGEPSFGKGTIQEAEDLSGGAGLHITTARWLLPSGRSINKEGIEPDIEAKDDPETLETDEQLQKAIENLNQ